MCRIINAVWSLMLFADICAMVLQNQKPSFISRQSSMFQKMLDVQNSRSNNDLTNIKVPSYMLDLWKMVTDKNGQPRKGVQLAGNVVRSFFNEAVKNADQTSFHFYFNVADIAKTEILHRAELRVYKVKSKTTRPLKTSITTTASNHFYRVEVRSIDGDELISSKLISARGFGWETFDLIRAVRLWVQMPDTNKGIKVIIKCTQQPVTGNTLIRFEQTNHPKHEPILVVYSDDNTNTQKNKSLFSDKSVGVKRRRVSRQEAFESGCRRSDMIVDVAKIKWDLWILQPLVFNAYQCKGVCGVYSSKHGGPRTNHASVQAILSTIDPDGFGNIKAPCCAPKKLEPMSLLLYDNVNGSPIVKLHILDDMVVSQCSCL